MIEILTNSLSPKLLQRATQGAVQETTLPGNDTPNSAFRLAGVLCLCTRITMEQWYLIFQVDIDDCTPESHSIHGIFLLKSCFSTRCGCLFFNHIMSITYMYSSHSKVRLYSEGLLKLSYYSTCLAEKAQRLHSFLNLDSFTWAPQ